MHTAVIFLVKTVGAVNLAITVSAVVHAQAEWSTLVLLIRTD